MLRGEWFAAMGVIVLVLLAARAILRRPLMHDKARPLSYGAALLAVLSLLLLVFHCTAMFAPDAVAALRVLDAPAARVRDLSDPVGRAAYWLPALVLLAALARLWWPAPAGLAVALLAVGVTMYYGQFTVTEHVATIFVAGVGLAIVATGLVTRPVRPETRGDRIPSL